MIIEAPAPRILPINEIGLTGDSFSRDEFGCQPVASIAWIDMPMTYKKFRTALSFSSLIALFFVFWAAALELFVLVADPYGVSPISVQIPRFNAKKIARVDIDRAIKPFEVWKYQPKIVFLGTSRIHQSVDASLLADTALSPAYNASIPAGSLASNIANLDEYARIDPHLKTAYVELFLWNFLGTEQNYSLRTRADFLDDIQKLFVSGKAVFDSFRTVGYNLRSSKPVAHIAPDGHYVYAPGHQPAVLFSGFPEGIQAMHPKNRAELKLYEPAFRSFEKLNEIARVRGIRVVWLVTPEHAYVDQWIDSVGAWDVVAEWLKRLSKEAPLYSFSQPNDWVYELVSNHMKYWYDPFHFSSNMGAGMLAALTDMAVAQRPPNFMVKLTQDNIGEHIESRRRAIGEWARSHPQFIQELEQITGLSRPKLEVIGRVSGDRITVNGHDYHWTRRIAGSLESAKLVSNGYLVTGWAVDGAAKKPVRAVVACAGDAVLKWVVPDIDREDIKAGIAPGVDSPGFRVIVPIDSTLEPSAKKPIRVFALMEDGTAVQLASSLSAPTAGKVADAPFVGASQN